MKITIIADNKDIFIAATKFLETISGKTVEFDPATRFADGHRNVATQYNVTSGILANALTGGLVSEKEGFKVIDLRGITKACQAQLRVFSGNPAT